MVKIGLQFDTNLLSKHPQIMASHSTQNNNTCFVCFTEFDSNEMKAESLACGHQYCKNCWKFYLIDKVNIDGS